MAQSSPRSRCCALGEHALPQPPPPKGPSLSRSHLAGRAATLRLPRGMVVAVGLGRADQRPQRWWRFCLRDRRDTACHRRARGGASGTRPQRAGRGARRHLAPAGPGLTSCGLPPLPAAVSAGNTTLRPPCACPELCAPRGPEPKSPSAEGFAGRSRGAGNGVGCCPVLQGRGRREATGGGPPGRGPGGPPGCAPLPPIRQGLRTSVWSQGRGGGGGGRTRAAKRCLGVGGRPAGPESRSPARGRPEPVFDSFLAKMRCRHGQPRTAPPGVR